MLLNAMAVGSFLWKFSEDDMKHMGSKLVALTCLAERHDYTCALQCGFSFKQSNVDSHLSIAMWILI